ncbi:MAG: plasmid pRiA4b ORF-3 family protein [Alphaproteobacteria bacterium]|nr:plasmid pRiA4b ORF-3 family protein [Alphaproteobacteria bacterium]
MSERVARIRIALNDIEPEIWRRVEVPLDITLKGLHDVIQAAMAWQDYHLFEFAIDGKIYGMPSPEWGDERKIHNAKSAKLTSFVDQGIDTFEYVYDMGDNWQHTVTVEAVEPANTEQKYPCFVDGARPAPPEDVGGFPGYYEFIEAVSKPRHREHKRMLQWYGGPYDPDDIDAFTIRLHLGEIAKRRHAGKIAYRKRQST